MFLAALVVAVLALVLVAVAQVQGALSPGVRALRAEAAQDIAAESLGARVAFMMLTEPIGPRSLVIGGPREASAASSAQGAELRLDGRFYEAGWRAFISVQDESGLINLNAPAEAALAGLIERAGESVSGARRLAAALADFTDEDDLVRTGGAESAAYARLGLSAPANHALTVRWEALETLGWRDSLDEDRLDFLWAHTVVAAPREGNVNVNTAPTSVIEALVGDAATAATLIARLEHSEIREMHEVEALTGARARAAGAGFAIMPGDAFRIVVAFGDAPGVAQRFIERRLVLAGTGADRPVFWSEERRGRGGAWRGRHNVTVIEPLPRSAALPPA